MTHFILTRFNLRLWPHSKRGEETYTEEWLKQRVTLFERFCFPSIQNQSCKEFKWIVLFDEESPSWLKDKALEWKTLCPQFIPVGVVPEKSRDYVDVFCYHVNIKRDGTGPCITTYLDNDDALCTFFVEETQKVLMNAYDKCPSEVHALALYFPHGLQFFTELNIATRIRFTHNHFVSMVEWGSNIRTIFGYGSHYFLWKHRDLEIVYVDDKEHQNMWMEVVHERNVDNDIWMTLDTRLISWSPMPTFGLLFPYSSNPWRVFLTKYLLRVVRIFFVHLKHKLFGHDWWK